MSGFIGRETELGELKALLAETRLLTLAGAGGCGKTTLARRLAEQVQGDFPDGATVVELTSLADPSLVAQAVANRVGVREAVGRSLLDAVAEGLEGKRLLLVLDNCEHVLDAAGTLCRTLLARCPHLRLLATSQEMLHIRGETVWRVPNMACPDPRRLPPLDVVCQYDGVQLFVTRASAANPDFALTEDNAPLVAQICARLDGIPLALELAAARTRVLSLEQLADRLQNALKLLKSDTRADEPRHQTLRATLDWSYGLLSPDEQALLRRLSVFAGGFTLEAAEEVIGDAAPAPTGALILPRDDILDLLTALVDKSLVVVTSIATQAARYRLLEPIRQYGQDRLQEAEAEAPALYRCHAEYYLKLAEAAEERAGHADYFTWLARLETEHDNFRAALDPRRALSAEDDTHLKLVGSLWRFWWEYGYISEGRERLEAALARAPDVPTSARARVLHGAGFLAKEQGDYPAAADHFQAALAIHQQRGDKSAVARLLSGLGQVAQKRGDYDAAQDLFERSLALRRELGGKVGIASTLHDLGIVANYQARFAEARAALEESLSLRREIGDQPGIARLYNSLGETARGQGDLDQAEMFYEQSIALSRQLGNRVASPWPLHNLAYVALGRGDVARAAELFKEALRLFHDQGKKEGIAACLAGVAAVAGQWAEWEQAARLYGAAEAIIDVVGVVLIGADRVEYEPRRAAVQAQLGGARFAALKAAGQGLTLKAAIAEALAVQPPPTPVAVPPAELSQPLAETAELRIHAFGTPRVYRQERLLTSSDKFYAKAREMLFYLLSDGPRTRQQLALDLWPDASADQIRHSLHNTLNQLRSALGRNDWIGYANGVYAFRRELDGEEGPACAWVDVDEFEARVRVAQGLKTHNAVGAIDVLRAAVALYQGDYLSGEVFDWALERQEELRRQFQDAALSLAQLLFDAERYGEAEEVYRRVLSDDSYLEAAHCGIMRCLARQGARPQALRHYQSLVDLLQRDLEAEPMAETTALYERIKRGET